jgi:hypothetical protein
VFVIWARNKSRPKFYAASEYRLYVRGESMPESSLIMNAVLRDNTLQINRQPAIGPQEALLFSDVRFHIGLVLRRKNPHVFRSDIFDKHVEPTPEIIQGLGDSDAYLSVRYISDVPLDDRRHVQLLPHVVRALTRLTEARVVYDVHQEKMWSAEEFVQELEFNPDANRADLHVRAVWEYQEDKGGHARTLGMIKLGLPELETGPMEPDEQRLVIDVLESAAAQLWSEPMVVSELEVEGMHDRFRLLLAPVRKGRRVVRILRMVPQ